MTGPAAVFRPFDRLRAVPSSVEGRLKPEATNERACLPSSGGRLARMLCSLCVGIVAIVTLRGQSADPPWPVRFTDVAEQAGLRHPSIYGGVDTRRFILETNGCGTG